MKSKILSLFIFMLMIGTCLMITSDKVSADQDGDYTYVVNNGEAYITAYTGVGGNISIPSTLGGYPTVAIWDNAFLWCQSLTSVIIPNSVNYIGQHTFFGCTSMTSVTIGNGVTVIGDWAFKYCTSLTSVTIPNNVNYIGSSAFQSCEFLASVTIGNGVTAIGDSAFFWCNSLKSVTIPNSVVTIWGSAFHGCISMTSATIGSGVTTIRNNVFSGCTSLNSIIFLGLVAPTIVDEGWFYNTPDSLRGHAYAASNFPFPGAVWNGLTMSEYIPNIVYVDDDFNPSTPGWGYDHFDHIQNGVNVVEPNGNVYVYNGTYQEQIDVTKSVVLQGENNVSTIVVGGFNVYKNATTVENFNITQGFEWIHEETDSEIIYKIGIYSNSSNITISDNHIWNITGQNATGIYLQYSSFNNISYNTISNIHGGDAIIACYYEEYYLYHNGGFSIGIYQCFSSNTIISYNNLSNIKGGDGESFSGFTHAGTGGFSKGIFLNSSYRNFILNNQINEINGGAAGDILTLETPGISGDGGSSEGVVLINSSYNEINYNNISYIFGGRGGSTGEDASGGLGGETSAINVISSTNNNISVNHISNIISGAGGDGDVDGIGGDCGGIILQISDLILINNNVLTGISGGNGRKGGDSYGVRLKESNMISINDNTIFQITGGDSNWYTCSGGIASGIFVTSCNSIQINLNTIYDLNSGNGGNARWYTNGGNGGDALGVFFYLSNSSSCSSNVISWIIGGDGGIGEWCEVGGSGGKGAGVSAISSQSIQVVSNIITQIFGGSGGESGGCGGLGGCGIGIDIISSNYSSFINNTISTIVGNIGGSGFAGGSGGNGIGIGLQFSSSNNISFNNLENIIAGSGRSANVAGGNGGLASGIYSESSILNDIFHNYMCNLSGGNGGSVGIEPDSSVGNGGISSEIYLRRSSINIISSNQVSNSTGGDGGSGENVPGGDGASGFGIYLYQSNSSIITHNIVCNNSGGTGGIGSQGSNGTNGMGIGISFNFTISNLCFDNYISNNTNNIFDNGNNKWNITKTVGTNIIDGPYLGGNYWDDYSGVDLNGDGIGDTDIPYGSGDYLPLVKYENLPPLANFTYTINDKTVSFDGSASSDINGFITDFLWQFGDGTNGTGMLVNHLYQGYGTYTVSLTVIDNEGDSNATTIYISLVDLILPEIWDVQDYPDPQHIGKPVSISCLVTDNVAISTVKVHITSPDSSTINQTMNFNPATHIAYLNSTYFIEGTYEYFIWANDTSGNTNISSQYFFEIINNHPNIPSNPSPIDGATNIDPTVILSWTSGDQDPGDTVTYNVYFGTSTAPPQVGFNQSSTSYNLPEDLSYNTRYYWKIISWDNHGASTNGPMWHFTTIEQNYPPEAPLINGPTSGNTGEVYTYTFVALDPNDDNIYYQINWGDGQVDDWYGPCTSNMVITRTHQWNEKGTYIIQARAKDVHDAIGEWGSLSVTMPLDLWSSQSQVISLPQVIKNRLINEIK